MNAWNKIETAPKDGTEILAWREDAGCFLVRWTSPSEFFTESEQEKLPEESLFQSDWFYADFVSGGRLEGSEVPTHWMPLPEPPQMCSLCNKPLLERGRTWTDSEEYGDVHEDCLRERDEQ